MSSDYQGNRGNGWPEFFWYSFMITVYEGVQHWWSRFREPEPVRCRCETYQGLVCDMYYAKVPGTWILERVWD